MSMNRRHFLSLLAGLSASSLLPAQDKKTLTLWGPPVAPTVLLAVAAAQGQAKNIIPFQVKVWRNPDQLRAGLLKRDIEISIVPSYVAANFRAQGQPVILHNIMTRGLLYVLAKKDAPQTVKALSGAKIITAFKNDMPDLLWQLITQRENIQTDTHFVATPPEAVSSFLQQDYSHALLPEPLATMALAKGKEMNLELQRAFSLSDFWPGTAGIPQAGLMLREDMKNSHAEFLAALDVDLQDAVTWVAAHAQEAAALAQAYLPAPKPVLAQSFPHSALSALRSREVASEILDFLNELHRLNPKITGGRPADASLFG